MEWLLSGWGCHCQGMRERGKMLNETGEKSLFLNQRNEIGHRSANTAEIAWWLRHLWHRRCEELRHLFSVWLCCFFSFPQTTNYDRSYSFFLLAFDNSALLFRWCGGDSITQFGQQILHVHGRLLKIRCSLSLCSAVWNRKHCQGTFISAFSRHFSSAPTRCHAYIILGIVKYMPL